MELPGLENTIPNPFNQPVFIIAFHRRAVSDFDSDPVPVNTSQPGEFWQFLIDVALKSKSHQQNPQ